MSDGVAAGQELIPLLSVPLLCRAPASPWGCPALSSAAVQDGTVLLTGRQPLSLPIKILHRGVLPCPSSWPGCSAVEAAAVPRLASRDHIPAPKQPRASPAQPLTDSHTGQHSHTANQAPGSTQPAGFPYFPSVLQCHSSPSSSPVLGQHDQQAVGKEQQRTHAKALHEHRGCKHKRLFRKPFSFLTCLTAVSYAGCTQD